MHIPILKIFYPLKNIYFILLSNIIYLILIIKLYSKSSKPFQKNLIINMGFDFSNSYSYFICKLKFDMVLIIFENSYCINYGNQQKVKYHSKYNIK